MPGGSNVNAFMFMCLFMLCLTFFYGCTAAHHSQVKFCTFTPKLQVTDPTSEWQLKFAAMMKTCALGHGTLQALQHEEWIFGQGFRSVKAEIRTRAVPEGLQCCQEAGR